MITNLKWISDKNIKVTLDTGEEKFCQWPNNGTWYAPIIQEAIDSGIQIETKDPSPPAIDFSDADNLEKALKALGLVVATWSSKTPAQLKTAFKTAWDSLP